MKKFLILLFIILIICLIGLVIGRNIIAKNVLERSVDKLIGQKLTIKGIQVGLLGTDITIEDLRVYNPSGYSEVFLTTIPEIFVDYALLDIIKGFIHLPELRLDLKEINVEKDKGGVLNLDHFKAEKKEGAKGEERAGERKFLIDKMILKIGTIRYKDNTKTPPEEKVFQIDYSEGFTDVTSPDIIIDSIRKEVIERLIERGIKLAVEEILKDKEVQEALKAGDIEGLKKEGGEKLEGLRKKLFNQ